MINGKAFLYLMVTLIIGFALGLFSGGLHQLKRRGKMEPMGPQMVIGELLARDLQLSDSQMSDVSEILNRYEQKFTKRREEIKKQVEADLDSMRIELQPFLDKEQLKRLDDWIETGPPPGPGPQPQPGTPGPDRFRPPPGDQPQPPPPAPGQGDPARRPDPPGDARQ